MQSPVAAFCRLFFTSFSILLLLSCSPLALSLAVTGHKSNIDLNNISLFYIFIKHIKECETRTDKRRNSSSRWAESRSTVANESKSGMRLVWASSLSVRLSVLPPDLLKEKKTQSCGQDGQDGSTFRGGGPSSSRPSHLPLQPGWPAAGRSCSHRLILVPPSLCSPAAAAGPSGLDMSD